MRLVRLLSVSQFYAMFHEHECAFTGSNYHAFTKIYDYLAVYDREAQLVYVFEDRGEHTNGK